MFNYFFLDVVLDLKFPNFEFHDLNSKVIEPVES